MVKSEVGRGTTFELLLPYSPEPIRTTSAAIMQQSAGTENVLSGRTILIIEDEEALRVSVARTLKKRGLAILTADNGASGVSKFRSHASTIDVVLLDMTLPQLSGRHVLEEIRRLKPQANIILTSAYGWDYLRTIEGESPLLPQERFIRKPYQTRDLIQVLQECIAPSAPHHNTIT